MTRRLLIASPAKGGIPTFYFQAFLDVARVGVPGYSVDFVAADANHILSIDRSLLAADAIKGEYDDEDKVLMIDTDMRWGPAHVARVVSHDVPVVSGIYCKKRPGPPMWLGLQKKGALARVDGLMQADFLPTGFLAMKIGALRKIARDNPEREFVYSDDQNKSHIATEIFPVGVVGPRTAITRLRRVRDALAVAIRDGVDRVPPAELLEATRKAVVAMTDEQPVGRLLSEDYYFSFLAQKSGIDQWLDTKLVIPHQGTANFPIGQESVATPTGLMSENDNTSVW